MAEGCGGSCETAAAAGSSELMLQVITSKDAMRAFSRQQKREGRTVAFVPTMGYLHQGHISLVEVARRHADVVVASIYVNPTQFSANEDFDVYPRNSMNDRLQLQAAGCAAVFEPEGSLYYTPPGSSGDAANVVGREGDDPDAHETWVSVERLSQGLCSDSRPHFFRGVATVVCKLFHIVEPDVAVFGRKDYQQWRIITRMVRDLDMPVQVIGVPTAREQDGLAMSSRNARLSAQARADACCISAALAWAVSVAATANGGADAAMLVATVRERITNGGGQVDYVELRDADNLSPVQGAVSRPTLLAVAAWFPARDRGTVRLIDNTVLLEEESKA